MSGLFDAIIKPSFYFKKKPETYLGSFFSLILIIIVNELSYQNFIIKIIGFYGLSGILFLFLIPLFVYFSLIGLDLLFVFGDKNHWLKTHVGLTYAPYLFLPLIIPIIMRNGWIYRSFGWLFVFIICFWSFLLYKLLVRNKILPFIRLFRDFVFIMIFVLTH